MEQMGNTIVVFSDGETWEEMNDEINVVILTKEGEQRFSDDEVSLKDMLWYEEDGVAEVMSVQELVNFYLANRKEVTNG